MALFFSIILGSLRAASPVPTPPISVLSEATQLLREQKLPDAIKELGYEATKIRVLGVLSGGGQYICSVENYRSLEILG